MAWSVYTPKKKSPWTINKPKPKKGKFNWSVVSKNKGATPAQIKTGTNKIASRILGSSSSSASKNLGFDPYPAYNDPYSQMLAQLAAMKASEEADMRATLTGREGAITKLYADQGPLVDANYNQAIKSSAAVNDAVANRLSAEGTAAGGDLLSKLSAIGAPQGATDTAAQAVKSYYSGLGGANYAMDAGDVQRLIGQQAEQNTYNQKQPGIIASQLEAQFQSDLKDLLTSYNQQVMGLTQAQAQGLSDYQMSKFGYEQDQKTTLEQTRQDAQAKAEATYWDNYWKNRDEMERRWEVQVASGDKKAALKTKAQMSNLDRQSKIDIAQIRGQATTDSASIRATASVQNAQTAAASKAAAAKNKGKKPTTGATIQKAKQDAYAMVVNPNGQVRDSIRSDSQVQGLVNNVCAQYGIAPYSSQGTAIRKWIFAKLNGRKYKNGDIYKSGKDRLP